MRAYCRPNANTWSSGRTQFAGQNPTYPRQRFIRISLATLRSSRRNPKRTEPSGISILLGWIYGALTTEFSESNPEPSALALIDHLLQRPNEARFEDYVMVENKLAEFPFASLVRSSGLLQFRKLTFVKQAVSRNDMRGRTLAKDPLKKAWVLLHGDLVFYFDPDDGWFVRPEAYWDL